MQKKTNLSVDTILFITVWDLGDPEKESLYTPGKGTRGVSLWQFTGGYSFLGTKRIQHHLTIFRRKRPRHLRSARSTETAANRGRS